MHTIDLLRGQGIPAKTTLGGVTMLIVMVVVPILAAAWMVDRYMQNETYIEWKQESIKTEQETIDKFADAVKSKESLERQQGAINSKLSEVSSCLGNYIQWSPVLETLAEHMPDEMVMSGLRTEITSQRQKVASENDPKRMVNVNVSSRMLVLDISGSGQLDYASMVKTYKDLLKSSPVLGPKLESIESSQKFGGASDINTITYKMDLKFKSGSL